MKATRSLQGLSRARAEADAAAMGLPRPKPTVAARRASRHEEDEEQEALVRWAIHHERKWPQLALLHAIPNGGSRSAKVGANGKRFSPEAARLKRQGLKPGVPDLDLPVPREAHPFLGGRQGFYQYAGLRIEMKRRIVAGEKDKPRVSAEQGQWLKQLQDVGHCCCVCYGWDQAREVLEAYLRGDVVPYQWGAP